MLAQQEMHVVSVIRVYNRNSLIIHENYYDMLGRIQANLDLNNGHRHSTAVSGNRVLLTGESRLPGQAGQ